MLLCHCHRVSDRQVRRCVRRGASSADEVGGMNGAGTGCGGCRRAVAKVVDDELEKAPGGDLLSLVPA